MLKQGSFINKRFNMLVLGNIWGWLGYCVNIMTDSLISGNQLGEVSLQAVTIVFPLFSIVYFFTFLVAPGASVIFGKSIGQFMKDDADRAAGTSLIASTLIGVLLAAGLFLIKEPFLSCYGCTGELYREASAYYNWLIVFAVIYPVSISVYYLVVTDGEGVLLTIGSTSNILVNVIFSVIFSRTMGIAGLGLATCLGAVCAAVFDSLHFLKKSNNVKFRFCLDMTIVGRSVVLGSGRYMSYLFMAVVDIVLNKIIISSSGVELIPAYSVVNLVFGFCEMFGSLNDAGVGLVTCFLGEKNNRDMALVLRKTAVSMLIMSAGITAFFFFAAPLMPVIYGLETPVTVAAAVTASRIMAFSALGFGACYLCGEISCSVEKPFQACFICMLYNVFAPLLLSLTLGSMFGFTGIVVGMCLSSYFAFGLYALISIPRKGKRGFPIYVEDFGEEGYSYDIRVAPDAVIELREAVCGELAAHGFGIKNAGLLIEEFFTRVSEKNPNRSVLAECTLLFGADRVRIIIRDDGTLFNYSDENNIAESLNAHVLNSLLENTPMKNYALTTSFNRSGFVFEK